VGPTDRRAGHDSARAELLALVRAQVQIRFSLTAETLADRVLSLPFMDADPDRRHGQLARLVLDDLYLALACADGDDDAWREVERAHFAFIRDFAGRFLHGAEAEDLAAAVIADLWQRRKIAQFQGRSSLRTWLGAVVTRMALNARASPRLRAAATAPDLATVDPPAPPAVGDDEGRALARLMQQAIDRLDAEEKLLLLFHYEQGLSLDAMAPLLGASKATLSRRISALRDRLRQNVETMAVAERGPRGAESLRPAIDRAHAEFDLAALLGGARVKGGADGRV
jgi:RNA polymerase sigma-70 factor (ECF subfamily)